MSVRVGFASRSSRIGTALSLAALVVLAADARSVGEVSITVEPDGGSKEPTTKPLMDAALGSQ